MQTRDFSDIDILKVSFYGRNLGNLGLTIIQKFWESLKASLNSEEAKKDVPLGGFTDQRLVLFNPQLISFRAFITRNDS